ncbi:transglycosylase-like protein with SLT domain [Paucimonas lemoignei]|uniref:Transglycosylase-like protein with SLT domain n=1 Tax=Paucimonas lemoignei TaxID=29443 RepID=A0A4R3HUM0_PAULE|nr:transglycosylase SLT domain-containing protein [Paucimonas lemoignei]TCS35715.1 transglycosylase-like protein with SLT domain [Paucimonas lemoignei]
MLYRFIQAGEALSRKTADQSAVVATSLARATLRGIMTIAHHSLMVLGVAAIAALTLLFVKPHFTDHLKALSPFAAEVADADDEDELDPLADLAAPDTTPALPSPQVSTTPASVVKQPARIELQIKNTSLSNEQLAVSRWISRRYRVASDATHMLVSEAYKNAEKLQLDPLLILAVAAIESGFNPFAESAGGAQGLMQVMSKVHRDKFREHGGVRAALDPVANIRVGSAILKDYVKRAGSVEAGLKRYVGAAAFATDSGYGSRVLAEYRRLQEVAGKSSPSTIATSAEPDSSTNAPSHSKKAPADADKSAAMESADSIASNRFSLHALS